MKRFTLWALVASTMVALAPAPDRAAAYTGSVLFPVTGGPNFAAGGQVVGLDNDNGSHPLHAQLWSSSGEVDLNPSGLGFSSAEGTDGTQQVGRGGSLVSGSSHALFWTGSAASAVDLHPRTDLTLNYRFDYSVGKATAGAQQVGYGWFQQTFDSHALLWSGTAASAVDLHPSGFFFTQALATDGTRQVGGGRTQPGFIDHALLWSGTAASAVDLHPTNLSGIEISVALGVGGMQQVGYGRGSAGSPTHALLWSGTAASAVDLHPTSLNGEGEADFDISRASGANGTRQVGYGAGSATGGENISHALLWSGTAASAVDLHLLLPPSGAWSNSTAYSIDGAGHIFGTAYGTYNDQTGWFGVEWSPVPEPSSLLLAALAGSGLLWMRRGLRCASILTADAASRS